MDKKSINFFEQLTVANFNDGKKININNTTIEEIKALSNSGKAKLDKKNLFDKIDINHLTLEEILEKYTIYAMSIKNDEKSKIQKRENDKMLRFWINPFHIALRNEIGRIGVSEPNLERITKDRGDKARLTQATIDKIKGKYIEKLEKKTYTINPQKAREEIMKILEEIKKSQQQIENKNLEQEDEVYQMPIEEIEKYTFETGPANNFTSYIKKYRLALENEGVTHSIEIYGDIELKRFYRDGMYRRVVLEAIEDLELENYLKGQTNKGYIGYIGNFRNIIRDGEEIWQQEIRESDLDTIQKIAKLDEKYKTIATQRNNYFKLGEDR